MSVEELMEALRSRYVKASRRQKSKILDEFAAVTGFHRKAAIRRLGSVRRTRGKRRGRPPLHTPDVVAALRSVWEVRGLHLLEGETDGCREGLETLRQGANTVPTSACRSVGRQITETGRRGLVLQ
jgi:hypothetical protein